MFDEARRFWIPGILALLLGLGSFLLAEAFPAACDAALHIRNAHEFFLAVSDQPGYPDWDARAFDGRGALMFRFVSPSCYLVATLWQALGVDPATAVKLTVLCFAVAGAFGMRRWLTALGKPDALPGALLFLFGGPLVAFVLNYIFLFQNLCAAFLLPWVFAGLTEADAQGRRFPGLAAGACGVIFWTHILTGVMTTYLTLGWSLIRILGRATQHPRPSPATRAAPFVSVCAMLIWAGIFASPYLVPVVATSDHIHFSWNIDQLKPGNTDFPGDPPYDAKGRPRTYADVLADLLGGGAPRPPSGTLYDSSIVRPWVFLALLTLLPAAIAGVIVSHGGVAGAFGWVGCFLLFLNTRASLPLWNIAPGFQQLQVSWRWLLPATVLLAPWAGSALVAVSGRARLGRGIAILGLPLLLGVLLQNAAGRFPQATVDWLLQTPVYTRLLLPSSCPSPETLPSRTGIPHRLEMPENQGSAKVEAFGFGWADFLVEVRHGPAIARINTHADPCWVLTDRSDGRELAIGLERGTGTMLTPDLAAGTWRLALRRRAVPWRPLCWLLTVAASALWLAWWFSRAGGNPEKETSVSST